MNQKKKETSRGRSGSVTGSPYVGVTIGGGGDVTPMSPFSISKPRLIHHQHVSTPSTPNLSNSTINTSGSGGNNNSVGGGSGGGGSDTKSGFSMDYLTPPISPFKSAITYTPPMEMEKLREKIAHLGWIGSPNTAGKGRARANSVAVGSPGSAAFLMNQLEELSRSLDEKEKDVMLAAEIGKMLLEKNGELEYQVGILLDYEKRFHDTSSQLEVMKSHNDTLNVNLKEATMINNLLEEKIAESIEQVNKLKSSSSGKSKKKQVNNDLDILNQELEELKLSDLHKERTNIKLKCENEILIKQMDGMENTLIDYQDRLNELVFIKEKYNNLMSKNNDLVNIAKDITTRKSIIDEYNLIKDNCEMTLESILTNTTLISNIYDKDEELKVLNETKEMIEKINVNNSDDPVVLQLIKILKEMESENVLSTIVGTGKLKFDDTDDNQGDDSTDDNDKSNELLPADLSTQNLTRSSILLLIAVYTSNKQKDIADRYNKNIISLSELQEDLKELNEKLQSNTKMNARLELDSLANINRIDELQQQLQLTEQLKQDMETLKQSYSQLELEKQSLENELSNSLKSTNGIDDKLKDTYSKLEQLSNNYQKLESSNKELQDKNQHLQDYIKQLEIDNEGVIKRYQDQIDQLQSDMTQLKETFNKDLEHANNQNQLLQSQIKQLLDQIDSSNQQHTKDKLDWQAETQTLEKRIKELQDELVEKEQSIVALNQQMGHSNDSNSELIKELRFKVEMFEKDGKTQHDSHMTEISNLLSTISQLKEDLTKQDIKHRQELELQQSKECIECKKYRDTLESQETQFQLKVKQLNDDIEALKSKECLECKSLKEEKDKLKQEMDHIQSKYKLELENERTKECLECKSLSTEKERLAQEITSLKSQECSECKQLTHILEGFKRDNQTIQDQLNEKCKEYKKELDQVERLKLEIEELNGKLKSEQQKECQQCKDHKMQIELLYQKSNDLIKKHRMELDRIQQTECDQCKLTLEDLDTLKTENTNIQEELTLLKQKKCQDCPSLLEVIEKGSKENSRLAEEIDSVKEKFQSLEESNQILTNQLTEANKKIGELEKVNQDLLDRIKLLESQLQEKQQETVVLKEKEKQLIDHHQQEINEKEKEINMVRDEVKVITTQNKQQCNNNNNNNQIRVDNHDCKDSDPLQPRQLAMIQFVNNILNTTLSTTCKNCIINDLKDSNIFCKILNHYINDCIDSRALHLKPTNQNELIENITLIIGSIKLFGADKNLCNTNSIINNDNDMIFNLLFEILYIGILDSLTLVKHPEIAVLWKENPLKKLSDDRQESWENFIALDGVSILKRWINYYLVKDGHPLLLEFSKLKESPQSLKCLLSHCQSTKYNESSLPLDSIESLILFCNGLGDGSALNIVSPTDLISSDSSANTEKSTIFLLAHLFHLNSGLILNKNIPQIKHQGSSNNLLNSPSSEEKAAKIWLKTVDISAASLDDFRDGLILLRALDQISPGIVNWRSVNMNPSNTFSMTENCNYSVKLGRQLKFSLVGIAGKDFVDGNKKYLLSFVWQMMRYSVVKKVNLKGKDGKDISEGDLVAWANQRVSSRSNNNKPTTTIKGFNDTTLKDGIFILDLLDSISPGCIDYNLVSTFDTSESRKSNAKYAISVARRLGSTAIIFWEDIVDVKQNMIMLFILDLMSLVIGE